jgi:sulfite exporter TauE/SafE
MIELTGLLGALATLCSPDGMAGTGTALLGALLLAGAAGGAMHCAPMCGPFVLGQVSDAMARIPAARLCEASRLSSALLLPYHAGRLTTYAGLGAVAAALGAGAGGALGMLPGLLLLLAALLFVLQAARRLVPRLAALLPAADRAPAGWLRLIGRLSARIDRTRPTGGYLLGIALGFLPCGFLYAAIAAAAASGSIAGGALAMLAFGLGTLPALIAVGFAGQAAGRTWQRGVAAVAPALMLVNAAVLGTMAWQALATAA